MKKAFDEPDQPSANVRSGQHLGKQLNMQCEVAFGLQYGQPASHSLSERTTISVSEVRSVPSKGTLSAATLSPCGAT